MSLHKRKKLLVDMKSISLMIFFLLVSFSLFAQTAKWDSTYRPANYKNRLAHFQSYPNSKKDIIFLGNSISAHPDWSELLQNKNARNRGISSDISFGVLERLDEITEGKPAKVFILIGINDISRNIPDSFIKRNHIEIVRRIKQTSPKTKIYLQTLLPVNNEFTQHKNHYNKDEHIAAVNEALKDLALKENVLLVDLHPHFADEKGKLNKKYTMDGLHLNAEGYKLWKQVLEEGRFLTKKDKK
jgi:lysophospholipase L1-like esterase